MSGIVLWLENVKVTSAAFYYCVVAAIDRKQNFILNSFGEEFRSVWLIEI